MTDRSGSGSAGGGDPHEDGDLDAVWKALANPIRRRMLDLLRDGALTTTQIADAFAHLSRFAVMQHLRVLVDAELVTIRRSGRRRFNHLNPVPIQRIHDRWVSRYRRHWAEALVDLKAELESNQADRPSADSAADGRGA